MDDAVALVREWLRNNPGRNRADLARHVCDALGLRNARGELRRGGTLKALRVLEERGYWRLPEPRAAAGESNRRRPRRLGRPGEPPDGVPSRAGQVRGLELVEVRPEDDGLVRTWNELMETEHPLEDARMVGRQLRYLVGSDHGWLGAVGFGSCALRLAARDEWIGWDGPMRRQFQDRVLGMRRFLIRPCVRCKNLASRVLGMVAKRVGADFKRRYGFEPWLLESFVNTAEYEGTCYRAANWLRIGKSTGRGRNGPGRPAVPRKDIYIRVLNRHWRRDMGIRPKSERITALGLEESLDNAGWVEAEFGTAELGHKSATARLLHIAGAKARAPSAPFTECCNGNRHGLKAVYRFINRKHGLMTPAGILSGHRRRTIRRISGYKTVLAVDDMTRLDFSNRLGCNGLGQIGSNQTGAVSSGLNMHSMLAFSETGLPLGVLCTDIYASHFNTGDKAHDRPIGEKESVRWLNTFDELAEVSEWVPGTRLIKISDREGDLFELFDHRRRSARNVDLLVRACHDRRLEDEPLTLFAHMESLPAMAAATVSVPRQRETRGKPGEPARAALPARTAKIRLRWARVKLRPPQKPSTRHMRPVDIWAILLTEPDPPAGAKPVRWLLLTTVPVESRRQALRCTSWYNKRWRIEEWHRVLKSGCRIEAHQHQSAAALAIAIAIDAVIGWYVMALTLLGREAPGLPCELVFDPLECSLLEELQPLVAPDTMRGQKKGL